MAWGDNTGNKSGNKGPWGNLGGNKPSKPSSETGSFGGNNNSNSKPQIDIINFFKNSSGGGASGNKGSGNNSGFELEFGFKSILMIFLFAILAWSLTGFYVVDASEEGVVTRFGKYHRTASEGLRYKLPSPFENVYIVKKTVINSIQIGYKSASSYNSRSSARNSSNQQDSDSEVKRLKESLMITGDTNIADVTFVVQWRIKDTFNYLFKVSNPVQTMPDTIKSVSESAMREIIGRTNFAEAMTTKRTKIEEEVKEIIQNVLNSYESGVEIYAVNLNDVQNPETVMPAFLDVETAKQDKETSINKALAYENEVVPKARGDAQKLTQEAEAYKQEVVSLASGDAQRFASIYNEYQKARDITRKRIYLETMQNILSGTDKVIIDSKAGSGVVPYMSLPEIKRKQKASENNNEPASLAPKNEI